MTATCQTPISLPAVKALNAPITDTLRENTAHLIYSATSYLAAAQAELAFGPTGRVGNLAAHLDDAFQALEGAFRALEDTHTALSRDSITALAGGDLGGFGYRTSAMADVTQ